LVGAIVLAPRAWQAAASNAIQAQRSIAA